MNALDLLAGLVVGGFLVGVVAKGKTPDLIALAKRDSDFLKWGAALAVLFYLRSLPSMNGIADSLIAGALLSLLIAYATPIRNNAAEVAAIFKGAK